MVKKPTKNSYFRVRHALSSRIGSLSQAGSLQASQGAGQPKMRILGEYAVVYLLDGQGRYRDANGVDQRVVAGDLMMIFPDLAHAYGPGPGELWTEIYLVFNGPVFALWDQQQLLNRARPVMSLKPINDWARRFESILGAPHQTGFAPPLVEVCRLQAVLAQAMTDSPAGGATNLDSHHARWLERACALLESNLSQRHHPQAIARQMNMSYDLFRKRFTRLMGVAPGKFRNDRIIDRACEMMQSGSLTDQQIAFELGFCDAFYFSKRFKQVVGCPPSLFRQRLPKSL